VKFGTFHLLPYFVSVLDQCEPCALSVAAPVNEDVNKILDKEIQGVVILCDVIFIHLYLVLENI